MLILISRVLAVTLLVLAFALPTIKENNQEKNIAADVIIYLDNAPALQNVLEGESRMNEAIRFAQSIIEAYPNGTKFHFIENSYKNSVLTDYTKETLLDLISDTDVVGTGRSLEEILSRIEASDVSGDVYLISDFKSGNGSIQVDSLKSYFLALVKNDLSDNIYVDTVFLENSFLSGSFRNQLNIELAANNLDLTQTNVKVYFNNQLAGNVSLDFEGTGQVVYELPENQTNLENIRLEIEDQSVVFDNSFYLSINSLQLTNVVEIFDSNSSRFISELFNENEFFSFERIEAQNLNTQAIQTADLIVLNGVNEYSNQLINQVNEALNSGINVVLIPSNGMSTSRLIEMGIRMVSDDELRNQLATPNFSDPFFQGVFEEESVNMEMPYATTNYRLLNPEYDLLNYLNGRPFLSKVAVENSLFVFTSPFDSEYTSFVNHALFVPVFYRLALGSQRNFANLYYYTDSETISFPLSQKSSSGVFQIKNDLLEITPDQRITEGELIMSFPKDQLLSGNYRVENSEEVKGNISFNQSRSESQFSNGKDAFLAGLLENPNVELLEASNSQEFGTMLQSSLVGVSLWKWAMALGLLFLFVEIILIRYL